MSKYSKYNLLRYRPYIIRYMIYAVKDISCMPFLLPPTIKSGMKEEDMLTEIDIQVEKDS